MKEFKDLTDLKFNRLMVIGLSTKTNRNNNRYWVCRCDCVDKTIKPINEGHLIRGDIKSCGCLGREKTIESNIKRTKTDGFKHYKRIYSIYDGMRKRCYNINNDNYKYYGAKGTIICDEWLNDFMKFYHWSIENNYKTDLTIDRIDTYGNYEPDNCRWATTEVQSYNKTNTIYLEIDGESKTVLEWEKISGLSYSVLWQRYNKDGINTKEEMLRPSKENIKIIHNDKEMNLSQLSKETGINISTLSWRHKQGLKDDELIKPADRWAGHVKSTLKRARKKKDKTA